VFTRDLRESCHPDIAYHERIRCVAGSRKVQRKWGGQTVAHNAGDYRLRTGHVEGRGCKNPPTDVAVQQSRLPYPGYSLSSVRLLQVLKVCDEFPELQLRLQSFKKAGLKLSQKGQQSKQARKYKEEAVAAAAAQVRATELKEGEHSAGPVIAADSGAMMSEAVLSRVLAAHTSEVMKAIQGINAKLSDQQALLEAQQTAQAELDRKLAAMVDR
jgi:hypothetical protein